MQKQEMIDLCNALGEPTGKTRTRSEVHAQGLWHRTVHIWILDNGGQALLQQRSRAKENHPGLWDISSAGHIDAGETSLQAAQRELSEELGLVVSPQKFQLLGECVDEQTLHDGTYVDREYHDIYIVRLSSAELRNIRFADGEVEAIRWLTGPALEHELRIHGEAFAPHPSEYPLILKLLGAGLAL